MKYKLLKDISSFSAGTILLSDNDSRIPFDSHPGSDLVNHLFRNHKEEYFEEVKETSEPRWKVGDKAVYTYTSGAKKFLKVFEAEVGKDRITYNRYYQEAQLRDPTPEELSLYFR